MAVFVLSDGASSKLISTRIFAQPMDKKIYLKPRKEESLLRQHPWVFSGAIKRMEGQPITGDLVEVCANKGRTLGFGHFSAHTSIAVRMLSFDAEFDADMRAVGHSDDDILKLNWFNHVFKTHPQLKDIFVSSLKRNFGRCAVSVESSCLQSQS